MKIFHWSIPIIPNISDPADIIYGAVQCANESKWNTVWSIFFLGYLFFTYEIKPVIHNLIGYSEFVSKASPKYVIRMQISGETDMK